MTEKAATIEDYNTGAVIGKLAVGDIIVLETITATRDGQTFSIPTVLEKRTIPDDRKIGSASFTTAKQRGDEIVGFD